MPVWDASDYHSFKKELNAWCEGKSCTSVLSKDKNKPIISFAGLAVDDQGNLYAPDLVGNQIWKIPNGLNTSSPNAAVLAVTLNSTASGLTGPNAVDFSNGQPLLVANAGDGNLVQIPREQLFLL